MLRLLLGAVAVLFASQAAAQLSPGPLSRPHEKLEGARNCLQCHEPGTGVSREKCLGCHTALRARIAATQGLHARPEYQQRCERCHNEHHGRDFALIHWGPKGMAAFDHALTGFLLRGAHAKVTCRGCHKTRSFLGLSQSCTSCHRDVHRGQFPPSRCESCHGLATWKTLRFDHARAAFPLTGRHAAVACEKCHPVRNDAAGAFRQFRGIPFAACTSCHRDPHAGRFGARCESCHDTTGWKLRGGATFDHGKTRFPLTGDHRRVACAACHVDGVYKIGRKSCSECHRDPHAGRFGRSCERCHVTSGWRSVNQAAFDHDKTRFPLIGGHRRVACQSCHLKGVYKIGLKSCQECHRDPHAGRMGKECVQCHTPQGWKNVDRAAVDHDKTRFPLRGGHREVACARCHQPGQPMQRGRFARCLDCHRDPHGKQLGEKCESCHTVDGFRPSRFTVAMHRETRFPLHGAHLAVPCNRCHTTLTHFRFPATTCQTCHPDPHGPALARWTSAGGCTGCHVSETWRRITFDHAKTGFVLEGAHARLRCASCHTGQRFQGLPRTCSGCHGAKN